MPASPEPSGIHTAVDTSGYVRAEIVKAAADLADLFLFDIKHMDDSQHRRWTGVSNRPILENLRRLSGLETSVWVRIPLIPGINDGMDNLEALADRLTEWGFSGTSGSADLRSVQIPTVS
jgi:pyruvate formate lyase activating enzyme